MTKPFENANFVKIVTFARNSKIDETANVAGIAENSNIAEDAKIAETTKVG